MRHTDFYAKYGLKKKNKKIWEYKVSKVVENHF